MSRTTGGPSALARVSSGDLILPTARSLRSNDVAYMLREENMVTADRKGWNRFQIIVVERNDRMVEYHRDLGPASDFPDIGEIIIIADGEYDTVDMLMEQAEAEREINSVAPFLEELKQNSTLVEDAVRLEEQKNLLRKRNTRTLR